MKMRLYLLCLFMLTIGLCPDTARSETSSFADFIESRQVVATVYFTYGSSDLSDKARTIIDDTLQELSSLVDAGKVVRIEGFASLEGANTNNMRLSLHRAESVALYLNQKGVGTGVRTTGYGKLKATERASARERRAEIAVYDEVFDLKPLNSTP